jgi:hypothetical protein
MCFSAGASFGAGLVLTGIGVASIRKVKQTSQLAFASIPLIFAIQQFSEGFLWLSFTNPFFSAWQGPTSCLFIVFAQMVWPLWVPLSILLLDEKAKRKPFEKILVILGSIIAVYMGYSLISNPLQVKIEGRHMVYLQPYLEDIRLYGAILYMVVTIVPPFVSAIRRMWTLGTAVLVSYIVTAVFYTDYVISVWCFFASVISISVYAVMYLINTPPNDPVQSRRFNRSNFKTG